MVRLPVTSHYPCAATSSSHVGRYDTSGISSVLWLVSPVTRIRLLSCGVIPCQSVSDHVITRITISITMTATRCITMIVIHYLCHNPHDTVRVLFPTTILNAPLKKWYNLNNINIDYPYDNRYWLFLGWRDDNRTEDEERWGPEGRGTSEDADEERNRVLYNTC
jgi:hypothetical protein